MDSLNTRSLDEYRVNACDAIQFKLVRDKETVDSVDTFNPEFTHQIFGESEQIFGYRDLKVGIFYTADSLSTCIDISYTSKVDPQLSKGVMPDDIMHILSDVYPYNISKNLNDFSKNFDEKFTFTPYGVNRYSYQIMKDKCPKKFSVFFIEHGMPGFEKFLEYHKRMESFLLFFIDGASAISTEDIQWCYYVIYENIGQTDDGKIKYGFIGYMTVYKFYAYPKNLRPRVSQVLILPPFRNNGHATQLLQTFYRDFVPMSNVIDIAVEDPSPEFQRIRDLLDCKRCLETPEVMQTITQSNCVNGQIISEKSSAIRFREISRTKLKLNRCQSRRVYEILRLFLLPRTDEYVKSFSDALTKRATAYFQRVRPDAMRGSSLVPKTSGPSSYNPLKKAFDEAADEYFESQLHEEVSTLLKNYQDIVYKLDRFISSLKKQS
ncbi:unnamed protein product [Schistosoma mattheei]|uniref:Histone acetyltransferase type B catalytic subunit n=3 Tax=Schistosoma TaxID=6181 RepID=A0A183P2G4_9TREM|nr:unnamed protein product [Schistosoma mattheei]VDP45215.1 unnamed protein product [Schistosoma mattheei]